MKQFILPVFFFSLFLLLYFGMHYYPFSRIATWSGTKRPLHLFYPMLFLFVSFPLASVLERFFDSSLARFFYTASSVWLGVLFYLFFLVLISDILLGSMSLAGLSLSPQQLKAVAVVVISLSLLISLYGFFSARNIQVEEVVIPVDNMPDGISEFSIVQLSDIHAGAINGPDFVRKNVEIANSLNPDVVVITGDLFDGSSAHSEEKLKHLVEPIKDLRARFGSFFVTGNHEKYVGADLTSGIVASLNVTPLRNSLTRVNGITLIGIDNPVSEMRKGIPELSELNIPKDAPSVLLYHVPVGIDDAVRHGISLQLSGHTHGGQIFPFGLFEKLVYKAVSGLYTQGSFTLYVSRGSGTWGPPMRVFAPPEITRITLTGK